MQDQMDPEQSWATLIGEAGARIPRPRDCMLVDHGRMRHIPSVWMS